MVIIMSKATETRATIQAYILSVVDSSGFENCDYFTKCETRENRLFKKVVFMSEYMDGILNKSENKSRYRLVARSSIKCGFYNVKSELMDSWGLVTCRNKNGDNTEKQYDKSLDEYWTRLSMAILMMFKELNKMDRITVFLLFIGAIFLCLFALFSPFFIIGAVITGYKEVKIMLRNQKIDQRQRSMF